MATSSVLLTLESRQNLDLNIEGRLDLDSTYDAMTYGSLPSPGY